MALYSFESEVRCMTKREALSYSQKQLYKQCKRKWYLGYEKGIEDTTKSEALIFGSFVHTILEQYMRLEYKLLAHRNVDNVLLWTVIDKAYDELEDKEILDVDSKDLAARLVTQALLGLKKDFKEIYIYDDKPAIELELTVDGVYTGIIDLVYIDKRGKIVLLDWKTSSRTYTNHQIKTSSQLIGYAWLLENYGVTVDRIAYGVLHKRENTAAILKVRHTRKYRDFHRDINEINMYVGHNILLPAGKQQLKFFRKEPSNCYAYRSQCQFYNQCWGEDIRDVEIVEIYMKMDG